MPGRATPIVTNEIYHVFNRGIDHRPTFHKIREYQRFKDAIWFYRYHHPAIRFSHFSELTDGKKQFALNRISTAPLLVTMVSYVLMPNHFHFLIRQNMEDGISQFLSVLLNSYTRYYNTKYKRIGPLFLDQFHAVRIETDEQLLHVSRYIHLNPFTSHLIKSVNELSLYKWSSLPEYLNGKSELFDIQTILGHFKSNAKFISFITDQASYQRHLAGISHLLFEESP